jgi:hypothetical protein
MCKTNRLHKWLNFSVAIGIAAFGLVACGGGGGGGSGVSAPSPTTKPAGVTYNAFIEDRVSEGSVTFDIDGGLSDGTTTVTLAPTPNGGCSFTSNPADPTLPVCSPIAGGQAFLLCNGTTGENFDTVFLKSSVVGADLSEFSGLKLSNTSCGNPLSRTTSFAIEFLADGSVHETVAGGALSYAPGGFSQFLADAGVAVFDYRLRYVLRKLVQGNKTTFIAMTLYENTGPANNTFRKPRLYVFEQTK